MCLAFKALFKANILKLNEFSRTITQLQNTTSPHFKTDAKIKFLIKEIKQRKLNENQIELLNLFIENDSQKINDYYTNLINEVTDIVENNIVATDNGEVIKRLVEVKKKLNTLKTQKPNIDEVEKIISLKDSFS